jgi:hypothetical protein
MGDLLDLTPNRNQPLSCASVLGGALDEVEQGVQWIALRVRTVVQSNVQQQLVDG